MAERDERDTGERGEVRRADEIGRRGRGSASKDSRLSLREGLALALAVLVVVFAFVNLDDVRVDLLVDSLRIPLIAVIVGCSFAGFVLGYLTAYRRSRARD